LPGAPVRNGDVLVPGYDVEGKLWTIQYIKEDGTKRFAKDSRKHGCFHVVGAANAAEGLQKLANSPVIALAEGYATAATVAKYGNVPAVAAFDSGNLLAVATALHERWPDKGIMIAGDDDHKLENNPGRMKALEAALAVHGLVVFPNSTAEQREKGMTDFNDLALENARLAKRQLEEAVWRARQQGQEQTGEIGKGALRLDSWAGRREIACEILKETPHRFLVRLGEDCLLPGGRQASKGGEVYVPKDAVERVAEQSMEARIEEGV
jgi:phage/plasmid primase-like uncharacterized protein